MPTIDQPAGPCSSRYSSWSLLVTGFLVLTVLGATGCSREGNQFLPNVLPAAEAAEAPISAESPASAAPGFRLANADPQSAPPAARADDLAPTAPDGGSSKGLIGGLRSLIQNNDILGSDEDVSNGLLGQLDQAATQLDQVRQSNRNAIRQANRQPRIGQNAASPNIVLIQLGRMPVLGPAQIPADRAPHYRRLLSESLLLTQFHAASPEIPTARWSLLSGKNPALIENEAALRILDKRSLPELLWNGGYTTALIGQWDDSALPVDRGFDEWIGFRNRKAATPFPATVSIDATQMQLSGNSHGKQEIHAIDLFAGEAAHFLERHHQERRPFFLMVALPEFAGPDDSAATGPPGKRIDNAIGTIVAALKKLQLRQNTCLILTAESGPAAPDSHEIPQALANGSRAFSHGLGEGNLRIPLCISWPGQIVPGNSDHLCVSWDLLPTLLEITSTHRRPPNLHGLSFASLLRGHPQQKHPLVYWSLPGQTVQAVRKGKWKGVLVQQTPGIQLYDLDADPGETINVAAQHPEVLQGLMAK